MPVGQLKIDECQPHPGVHQEEPDDIGKPGLRQAVEHQPVVAGIQRRVARDLQRVAQGDDPVATEREAAAHRQRRRQPAL